MAIHYNAFISYKHAELDNKVAAAIERDLEHYHIPGKIQKKTGYKKIERIFRDKDELPITSDLSSTIEEALFNADYLIVLCSKSTCLSTWVEREIKLFLQNHPLEHVLTVLAEGEPADVIPQILQKREIQRLSDNGEMETVFEQVEPLSCDYRLPRREARNTELPRLVATLIGCSYNELMDRQRQYRMRRLTSVFAGVMALSIGFGAYMLYSKNQINKNYQQALINQSKYLSNESEKLLDNEQRIGALQLALAALPNEENPDRPVIPEAVRAINKASLAYVVQAGSNISAEWNYTMPDIVDDYVIAADSATLAAIDKAHNVRVWDCESHKVMYGYESVDEPAEQIIYISDDVLLIAGDHFLSAVDVKQGRLKWENKDFDKEYIEKNITLMTDGSILVPTSYNGLYKLSAEDGTFMDKYVVEAEEDYYESISFSDYCLSPDEKALVFQTTLGDDRCIVRYDLTSKTGVYIDITQEGYITENDYLDELSWVDDDTVCIGIGKNMRENNYGYLNMTVLSTNHSELYCLNAEDLSLRWSYDFAFNAIEINSGFMNLDSINAVAYYSGNMCEILSKESGELLNSYNANESIIRMAIAQDDDYPFFITRGGSMSNLQPERGMDAMTLSHYFTDNIADVIINKGAYVLCDRSREVIFYGIGVYDEGYEEFDSSPGFSSISPSNSCYLDGILAVLDARDENVYISLFDAQKKTFIGETLLGAGSSYLSYSLLGTENGKVYAVGSVDDVLSLYEVDTFTMDVKKSILSDDYSSYNPQAILKDSAIVYANRIGYDKKEVILYDLGSEESRHFEIPYVTGYGEPVMDYSSKLGLVYFSAEEDCIIDTNTGEITDIAHSKDWDETRKVIFDDETGRIIVLSGTKVEVISSDMESMYEIAGPGIMPYGAVFYNEKEQGNELMLLVLYSDGSLYRYNAETGEYIAETDVSYTTVYPNADFSFDTDKNILYIRMGDVLDIIDLESWIELTHLETFLGYEKETDSFIVFAYDTSFEMKVGYFRQYSVEELIQKAQKMLEGAEMSEDFKASYGI